jgi:hypothetical protein
MTPDPASLAAQLNLRRGMRLWVSGVPDEIAQALDAAVPGLSIEAAPSAGLDAALVVVPSREALAAALERLRGLLATSGFVWLGWRAGTLGLDSPQLGDLVGPGWLVDVEPLMLVPDWRATKLVPRRRERASD